MGLSEAILRSVPPGTLKLILGQREDYWIGYFSNINPIQQFPRQTALLHLDQII